MLKNLFTFIAILLLVPKISAQTIQGYVYDTTNGNPLFGASVYLNGTTIGTLSDENGKFIIETDTEIKASLAISYLGYTTVTISTPYSLKKIEVVLKQKPDDLDEIVIRADSWSHEKKLREFKRQFLGPNRAGNLCLIVNEDDIDLWFQESNKTLKASAKVPIKIRNNLLGYEIEYALSNFEAKYDNPSRKNPNCQYVYYEGTSFYKDVTSNPVAMNRFKESRRDEFKGSATHFLRALVRNTLKEEGFYLYHNAIPIIEKRVFSILPKNDVYLVTFKRNFLLEYKRKNEQTHVTKLNMGTPLIVFSDGNYISPKDLLFEGHLSLERIGNTLPIDYKPGL